ncbi:PH domain-containing protein [Streptomyces sp. NRRL F-5126]|uniref:PH domain-containing protein n=1 Tax=Streptomyces sp. NRRL F-5126 TaxID=1463857 RepID=UPI00068D692E|nr:PH domain-containing protein [Streptomyces sp. NRRL F-5126]
MPSKTPPDDGGGRAHGAPPPLPVTFRPRRTRLLLLVAGFVMLAVIACLALLLDAAEPAEQAGFLVVAVIVDGVLALLARPKVVADHGGVTVVNLTRVRRLTWPEILAVNLRPGDPWVFLDLSDGTSMPALGIQPGIARHSAIRDARALRALVDAHGTGTESGAPPAAGR